jgi:lysophospholipase L1-like esterase
MNRTMVWVIAAGLAGGATGVVSMARNRAEQAPPGFSLVEAGVPIRKPSALGERTIESTGWSLDHSRAWTGAASAESITLTVSLPRWGRLAIHPAIDPGMIRSPQGRGFVAQRLLPNAPALVLQRSANVGSVGGYLNIDGVERLLDCNGTLPDPNSDPYTVNIRRTPDGFSATSGTGAMMCRTRLSAGVPSIRSGLKRVNIRGLFVDGVPIPAPLRTWKVLVGLVVGGLLSLGCARAEALAGLSRRWIGLGFVPLALGPVLLHLDVGSTAERVRMLTDTPQLFPVQIAVGLAVLCKLLIHVLWNLRTTAGAGGVPPLGRRWAGISVAVAVIGLSMGTAVLAVVAGAAVALGLAAGLMYGMGRVSDADGPSRLTATSSLLVLTAAMALTCRLAGSHSPWMTAAFSAAALAIGIVLWANLNLQRVRWPNPISIVAVLLALGWTEYGVRFTELGARWVPKNDAVDPEVLTFAMLDKGDLSNRMVDAMPPRRARVRVVAFGGSTTAGAYGQTDLSDYFPNRLDALLGPNVEVINQGVAGWTTFHLRHHLGHVADRLRANIWLLYMGFNDWENAGAGLVAPYAQLHEQWRAGGLKHDTTTWLGDFHLYQGLRFALLPTRTTDTAQPVPPADMRENLAAIARMAQDNGAMLWMVGEAVWPPDGRLDAHFKAMRSVAATNSDAHYVNAAKAIQANGDPMFLDEIHLSVDGHQLLAETIALGFRTMPAPN